jgi:hypothetical protein
VLDIGRGSLCQQPRAEHHQQQAAASHLGLAARG